MNKKVFSSVIAVVLSAVSMVPQAEARVEVVVNIGNPVVVMPVSPPPPVVEENAWRTDGQISLFCKSRYFAQGGRYL